MNRPMKATAGTLGLLALAAVPAQSAIAAGQAPAAGASCTQDTSYGPVTVAISVSGTKAKITRVTAPTDLPKSTSINKSAVPKLKKSAVKSGMKSSSVAKIRNVSGATSTSDGFKTSLSCALVKAGR